MNSVRYAAAAPVLTGATAAVDHNDASMSSGRNGSHRRSGRGRVMTRSCSTAPASTWPPRVASSRGLGEFAINIAPRVRAPSSSLVAVSGSSIWIVPAFAASFSECTITAWAYCSSSSVYRAKPSTAGPSSTRIRCTSGCSTPSRNASKPSASSSSPSSAPLAASSRRRHHLHVRLHEDRLEKRGLGGEVVIEGAGRDPCLTRQVLHRRTAEAVLAEQPAARGHQRSAGLRDLLGAQRRRL